MAILAFPSDGCFILCVYLRHSLDMSSEKNNVETNIIIQPKYK